MATTTTNASPRSIGSSELLNPIAHEVVLSNSNCELKITGYGSLQDGNGGGGDDEGVSSRFEGTLKPGTPGPHHHHHHHHAWTSHSLCQRRPESIAAHSHSGSLLLLPPPLKLSDLKELPVHMLNLIHRSLLIPATRKSCTITSGGDNHLGLLGLIRKLISAIFRFVGLGDFLEPEFSTDPTRIESSNHFQSVPALLIRELLPVVKFLELVDPPESCAVCLYEFDAGDEIRRLTNCRHIVHRCCLDRWMDHDQKTCPLFSRKKLLPPAPVKPSP